MIRPVATRRTARAFTLTELMVLLSAGALLATVFGPVPHAVRIEDQRRKCAQNLHEIGVGVAACYFDNNDYGPTWDDGEIVQNMLNWTDVLHDLDYVPRNRARLCPNDEHPDPVTLARAEYWDYLFDDNFGDSEPPVRGVRTSYAINVHMHHNFKEDRFLDASRQVYAIDGWWCWFGSLNAAWLFFEHVTGNPPPDPVSFPNEHGTMVGWRHGADYAANALYRDGHVRAIVPQVPSDPYELLYETVDTMQSFTWLPGERPIRRIDDEYRGEVPAYQGMHPYWTNPLDWKSVAGQDMPPDYPEALSCAWRTVTQSWVRFPNDRQ
ncbi:MAG: hypothetical protein KKB50_16975 [Planctomycetes bacterium]|nr:hypothetical protein [Planctomycetota bacterium]